MSYTSQQSQRLDGLEDDEPDVGVALARWGQHDSEEQQDQWPKPDRHEPSVHARVVYGCSQAHNGRVKAVCSNVQRRTAEIGRMLRRGLPCLQQ